MSKLNRRFFLTSIAKMIGGGTLLSACSSLPKQPNNQLKIEFNESVASGDPLSDRVILWTRLTPTLIGQDKTNVALYGVRWQISLDPEFASIANQGVTSTNSANDFCVKVDASGLESATQYYYRFVYGNYISPVGRTKTLPQGNTKEAKFAVVSCSNYGHGYFHVYHEIAQRTDLDFVLHLGDYIYEYRDDVYTDPKLVATDRQLAPKHETLSLEDYRKRYRCYRGDKDLQAVHANLPFIAVWDDHEIANDAWIEGAEGHQINEGDWHQRKQNAMRVYREYMPIRDPMAGADSLRIYRQFDIGNLASLIMLDTRLIGREEPLSYRTSEVTKSDLDDPSRNLLGQTQERWLNDRLVQSKNMGQTWQVIGQQLLTGRVCLPDISDIAVTKDQSQQELVEALTELGKQNMPLNLDAWDGYNASKQRLLNSYSRNATNVISLAGDTHNSWAFELTPENSEAPVAVEFATPSVSSPGMESWLPTTNNPEAAKRMVARNPELVYHDNEQRGWLEIRLTEKKAHSQFHFVSNVKTHEYRNITGPTFTVKTEEHRVWPDKRI